MRSIPSPLPMPGWPALAALALGALGATAAGGAYAETQPMPQGHMMRPAKSAELGTAAAIDARGAIWTVSKEVDGTAQYLVLRKSDDDGASWSAPTRILNEPEAIAADGESRPKLLFGPKGEFYVSYSKPLAKPYTGDVRFIRSLDGGHTFSAPVTVHADRAIITHRFDAMTIDPQGRIYVAWIDKRDLEQARARQQDYSGAAVYYAVSDDRGASFHGDYKVADHSCECCRIALTTAPDGKVMALWRHVFAPNVRDHALAELTPSGAVATPTRATFDDWHVDACPHQGPALAYAADGTRHQAWFTVKGEDGGVYYASAAPGQPLGAQVKLGSDQADHAAIAVDGRTIVLAWRQFNGKATAIMGRVSRDAGLSWRETELASTAQASDHPQLLHGRDGIVLVWRTAAEGVRVLPVNLEKKP